MRRNIILATVLLAAAFLLGGVYILGTIFFSTRALDRLIVLHQVQILRGSLLHEAESVQSMVRAGGPALVVHRKTLTQNVQRMRAAADRCSGCHHSSVSQSKVVALGEYVSRYEEALRRMITAEPGPERQVADKNYAASVGEHLIVMLNDMVTLASTHLEERTRESVTRINRANSILFVMVAVGPLLVILLAVFLVHSLHRPLTVLTEATTRLKAGDMTVKVPDLKHEFHELGTAFNEMVGAVNAHVHEMQRAEQMAALGQLAAGIAHEIKNPLAAIKLTLQVLASELDLKDDDRQLFVRMEKESQRIETLMRDLLSFARPREPKLESVDVNHLLERAGIFGLQRVPGSGGKGTGVEIRKELAPELPPIVGDADQLIQVFMNIVLNGIEIMREGGVLTIQTSASRDAVRVAICDQGPGVPEELKEKIFEPFFTRKPKGTGLGLAVTKRIVEQHRGSIRVLDAPGGGACFEIELPAHHQEA